MPEWLFQGFSLTGVLSLVISLYTLWKQRIRINVDWDESFEIITPDSLFFGLQNKVLGSKFFLSCVIDIVNPSPNDIGYFDLMAFEEDTNANLYLATKKAIPKPFADKPIYYFPEQDIFVGLGYTLDIPEAKNGIFPKNSFSRLNILVAPMQGGQIPQKLVISFKIASEPLLSYEPFFGTSRKQYRTFRRVYDTTGWEEKFKQHHKTNKQRANAKQDGQPNIEVDNKD